MDHRVERDAGHDVLPNGLALTFLPAIGTNHRMPDFWPDREVRRIVCAQHRQVTVEQCRAVIRERFGVERTPSKSALARAWKRIDLAIEQARVKPVRREF